MTTPEKSLQLQKTGDLKSALERYKPRLQEILKDRAPQFAAALVQIVNRSWALQKCKSESVIGAAITAAALDLSIDPTLGESYVIPYGEQAVFQMGYKGFIALAQRSGQYRRLGWMVVYDGQLKKWNPLTGELEVDPEGKKGDAVIGYAAYFQLLSGFERGEYWTKAEVLAHAARFSQAFKAKKKDSPWMQEGPSGFDKMALKTVLLALLRPFGPKSVSWVNAVTQDNTVRKTPMDSPEPAFDLSLDPEGEPETPPDAPDVANTTPEGEKPAVAAKAVEGDSKGKLPTPQEKLAKTVIDAGFNWDEFSKYAQAEGHLADASSLPGFEAVPTKIAERLLRATIGLIQGLTKERLE